MIPANKIKKNDVSGYFVNSGNIEKYAKIKVTKDFRMFMRQKAEQMSNVNYDPKVNITTTCPEFKTEVAAMTFYCQSMPDMIKEFESLSSGSKAPASSAAKPTTTKEKETSFSVDAFMASLPNLV